jgi:protein ImuB
MLVACLYVPDFPVQAVARVDEELCQQPVAVLDGTPPLFTVIAINLTARQKGMVLGMTKVQAELFDVKLRQRSLAQEAATHRALLDCAYAFSPRVEDTKFRHVLRQGSSLIANRIVTSPDSFAATLLVRGDGHGTIGDTVILDIEGMDRLFGSPQEIGQRLQQLASQLGLEVNVGIAANPEAATLAARGFPGVTLLPAGSESERLGQLPIEILDLPPEQLETFRVWGIHTLQAVAALPEIGLIERLGQEGKQLRTLARGADQRPLVPAEPELKFEETMDLEFPLDLLEPLTFVLSRLLNQLCTRLVARNLAAGAIRLDLEFELPISGVQRDQEKHPTSFHHSSLRLPVPMQKSQTLLRLLQLHLQSHPPGAPVKRVLLAAEATRPRTAQGQLFTPRGPEPERMELTLARISGIVGEGRVGSPVLLYTHKPDAFQMKKFSMPEDLTVLHRRVVSLRKGETQSCKDGYGRGTKPERNSRHISHNGRTPPHSALRRFRPALAARVELENAVPVFATFLNQRRKVIGIAGPWRSSGDWWSECPWARDEWDVTLALRLSPTSRTSPADSTPESAVYRLYQDLQTQQWFVEGVYD